MILFSRILKYMGSLSGYYSLGKMKFDPPRGAVRVIPGYSIWHAIDFSAITLVMLVKRVPFN